MNAEAQVLQALDAAQAALKGFRDISGEEHPERIRAALQQVSTAPWSMIARAGEADQHGWLTQLREALLKIDQDPYGDDVDRWVDEGLWAALELERDLRRMVGAR